MDEHARLARFCARLTGDPDAAQDLAQQALIRAWRHEHALRNPAARRAWLLRIARNVCLSWARRGAREHERVDAHELPDPFDPEAELGRDDLARLLDRALALLPAATRAVLVQRYVEEAPQREIATRLGLSEGAVEARLRRGKLHLRRLLEGELTDEAAALGLVERAEAGWRETRIWCPACGERRWLGRWSEDGLGVQFRCPGCSRPGAAHHVTSPRVLGGVKGFRPALTRILRDTRELHRRAVESPAPPCPGCGAPTPVGHPGHLGHLPGHEGVPSAVPRLSARCGRCGSAYERDATALVLALPAGERFWRAHPRLRTSLAEPVESAGGPAVAVQLRPRDGAARLEALFSLTTGAVLEVAAT
jgi:RNA polymerase sigma factor (sigma-70 family)